MKMRGIVAMIAASLALVGCGDSTGLEAEDLQGTWTASVYEYTDNANAQNLVDVIQRDGASFTLDVDEAGNASTVFIDGLGSTSTDSGMLNSTSTMLTLGGVTFDAVRDGDLLTLTDASSSFDFGSGSTSATLRVVMGRN